MKTSKTKCARSTWNTGPKSANSITEVNDRDEHRLKEELMNLASLARLGELIGPVSHEVNNFVNALLLQFAVLESNLSAGSRGDLAQIRNQATELIAMLEQLGQYRRRQCTNQSADLNRAIWRGIDDINRDEKERNGKPLLRTMKSNRSVGATKNMGEEIPIFVAASPALPKVIGRATDVRHLCLFLVSNAAAAAATAGGRVTIRTESRGDTVLLQIADTGPSVAPELLVRMFEPSFNGRAGIKSLEMAACKSLVANMGGKIVSRNLDVQGVEIQVELPAALNSFADD